MLQQLHGVSMYSHDEHHTTSYNWSERGKGGGGDAVHRHVRPTVPNSVGQYVRPVAPRCSVTVHVLSRDVQGHTLVALVLGVDRMNTVVYFISPWLIGVCAVSKVQLFCMCLVYTVLMFACHGHTSLLLRFCLFSFVCLPDNPRHCEMP